MNVNYEIIKLLEKQKELEKERDQIWQGFSSIVGGGFVFTAGSILAKLTIDNTPHWVWYLATGSMIFTVLFGFLLYNGYKEKKKSISEIKSKIKKIAK